MKVVEGVLASERASLAYRLQGQGRELVFIHGFSGSKDDFSGVSRRLSRDYRTLIYDLRGHGDSSSKEPYSLGALAQDLRELLEYLLFKNPVLVGFSLGAQVALEYSRTFSGIRGLVLVDSSPKLLKGGSPEIGIYSKEDLEESLELMKRDLYSFYKGFLGRILMDKSSRELEDLIDKRRPVLDKLYSPGLTELWQDMVNRDFTGYLERVQVPTLIIRGEHSIYPRKVAEYMRDSVRNSELLEFKDCTHQLILENPRGFQEALRDFMVSLK